MARKRKFKKHQSVLRNGFKIVRRKAWRNLHGQ